MAKRIQKSEHKYWEREIENMSKFKDHPHFVQYVDHADENKFVNILMKRVEGVSLGDLFEYMNKGMD